MTTPHEELTTDNERPRPMNYSTGNLVRSRERIIAGVCAGIANATKIDVGLVRIGAAVLALVTSGLAVVVYLVAWAVLPVEGEKSTMLDSLIETGKKQYGDYRATKDSAAPSSQPGPRPNDTFNPYDEN